MDDPFESPKLLIERAKENIDDFKVRSKAFFETRRTAPIQEVDPNTGEILCKIRLTAKLPSNLRTTASDGINNLRHALDQAVTAASKMLGATKLNKTYFPSGKDQADFENAISNRCTDVPSVFLPFLRSFKVHLGGDDMLWALCRLAGPNKHQFILGVVPQVPEMIVRRMSVNPPGAAFDVTWDTVKNEMLIVRIAGNAQVDYDVDISLTIAFSEGEIVKGQPVAATLDFFLNKVGGIVGCIEAEAMRLLEIQRHDQS